MGSTGSGGAGRTLQARRADVTTRSGRSLWPGWSLWPDRAGRPRHAGESLRSGLTALPLGTGLTARSRRSLGAHRTRRTHGAGDPLQASLPLNTLHSLLTPETLLALGSALALLTPETLLALGPALALLALGPALARQPLLTTGTGGADGTPGAGRTT